MDEFSLTAKQRRQLELVLHQTCDARLYRRVPAILEVSRGISVEEVAQTLGVTRQSVYIGHLPQRSVLLAEDETVLLLFPALRSCRTLRGQPAFVPISGRNARRVIFGALNLRTDIDCFCRVNDNGLETSRYFFGFRKRWLPVSLMGQASHGLDIPTLSNCAIPDSGTDGSLQHRSSLKAFRRLL